LRDKSYNTEMIEEQVNAQLEDEHPADLDCQKNDRILFINKIQLKRSDFIEKLRALKIPRSTCDSL